MLGRSRRKGVFFDDGLLAGCTALAEYILKSFVRMSSVPMGSRHHATTRQYCSWTSFIWPNGVVTKCQRQIKVNNDGTNKPRSLFAAKPTSTKHVLKGHLGIDDAQAKLCGNGCYASVG